MWGVLAVGAVGFVIVIIMALDGSSGARSVLKVGCGITVLAVAVIALLIYLGISRNGEQNRIREEVRNAAPSKSAQPTPTRSAKRGGPLSEDSDPCAVGIATDERLRRLRRYGPVRQTGDETYEAGEHRIMLVGGKMMYCQ